MIKIETKLVSSCYLHRIKWPEIKPKPSEPIDTIQGEEKLEEVWRFKSRAKNGKWPDESIGGQWTITISKDRPRFKWNKDWMKIHSSLKRWWLKLWGKRLWLHLWNRVWGKCGHSRWKE